jgi:hypothetical protein
MTGGNIIVGTVLGVLSGKYIFEEPLQQYWEAKRAEDAGAGASPTAASSTSDNDGKSR